jgi:hypothetical protein
LSRDNCLTFIHNDILKTDLHEADFLLMNHPFKNEDLSLQIEEKFLNELKAATKIATIIRPLRNSAFKKLGSKLLKFSWGDATVYLYEI